MSGSTPDRTPSRPACFGMRTRSLNISVTYVVRCDGDCIPMNLGTHFTLEKAREHAQEHVTKTGCRVVIDRVTEDCWEKWLPIPAAVANPPEVRDA